MNGFELLRQLNDIDDRIIEETVIVSHRRKKSVWKKYIAVAASITILITVIGIINRSSLIKGNENSGGSLKEEYSTHLLEKHREEFNNNIPAKVEEELDGENKVLLKQYDMINSNWFESDDLKDFSQAVTSNYKYYLIDTKDLSVQVYKENKEELEYLGETTGDLNSYVTQEQIETDLSSLQYEDYIICNSSLLNSIFVWIRSSDQDYFLVYPTRKDFIELEPGEIYTLEDVIEKLDGVSN
ncbi:MAG: hypothetical protein Q4F05_02690 [bacterium]|nr:hypothetical protein [bacterium]